MLAIHGLERAVRRAADAPAGVALLAGALGVAAALFALSDGELKRQATVARAGALDDREARRSLTGDPDGIQNCNIQKI